RRRGVVDLHDAGAVGIAGPAHGALRLAHGRDHVRQAVQQRRNQDDRARPGPEVRKDDLHNAHV
ncbi:Chorismate synthase, partial [Dysosmobacter welbionis]